jgi:hypothetical protein
VDVVGMGRDRVTDTHSQADCLAEPVLYEWTYSSTGWQASNAQKGAAGPNDLQWMWVGWEGIE